MHALNRHKMNTVKSTKRNEHTQSWLNIVTCSGIRGKEKGKRHRGERGERTEDGKELKMGEAWMGKAWSRWEKKGTGRDEQGGVHMNKQVG